MERLYNFNPGPAALPLEVLQQAQEEFVSYQGRGISLMEMSHRSPLVEQLVAETQQLLLTLMGLPSGYEVLFMGGGASTQFALIPMNLLDPSQVGSYVLSGSFAEKAYLEALQVRKQCASIAATTKQAQWRRVPDLSTLELPSHSAYVHVTSNNTIEGTQFKSFQALSPRLPLIADMTSDILSRDMDLTPFSLIYAAAQKNLGPAGVTVAVIRQDLIERSASANIPVVFRYDTYAKHQSLYNTPPVHTIAVMKLVLEWTMRQGGTTVLGLRNRTKASLIYDAIDRSGGYYIGVSEHASRSDMNVTWRMQDKREEERFLKEAEQQGLIGLAGHRSVGGFRASIYNAVPLEACETLAAFMTDYAWRHG